MNKKAIHTDNAPAAIGTYSQAIQAGGLVFLSGQIPLVPATMEVVDGDFEARARQVFKNLQAVAEAAGGNLNNAIKITLEEAREIYSLTQPGRYRVWFSMSFVQYDSAQIFIEDRNNDGVPENYAPFDATVYKGVIEYYEEYITLTTNEPAAGPRVGP